MLSFVVCIVCLVCLFIVFTYLFVVNAIQSGMAVMKTERGEMMGWKGRIERGKSEERGGEERGGEERRGHWPRYYIIFYIRHPVVLTGNSIR